MKKIYLFKMFLMAFVLMLLGGVNASAKEIISTLTFTKGCDGSGTADDNVTWTVTSDAAESTYDGTKGIHYGTGKKAVSYLTLTTSGISGTISKIVVNASGASDTSAKLDVTVGGSTFGSQETLTKDATEYTFGGSATGEIVVKLSQTSAKKALYVKSISVTYESSSTSTPTTAVIFDFTANPWGITPGGNSTSNTDRKELPVDGVVLTTTSGSGPKTCIYSGSPITLRVYTGGTLTFTAPEDYTISKIVFTGTVNLNTDVEVGTLESKVWTKKIDVNSVVFTGNETSKIQTVTITLVPTVENKTMVATDEEAYYSTFSCDRAVVFTNDVFVYAVNVTDGKLALTELTKGDYNTTNSTTETVTNGYYVPANTGVLISAKNANITYYTAATGQTHANIPANNQLVAATTNGKFEGVTGYKYYKLAYDDYEKKTGLGFYYGAAGGAAFEVKKGLAYLAVPVSVSGSNLAAGYAFGGNGGDDTTGINGIENDNVNETQTIYNLQGQRVEKAGLRGIYIVNGKKVVLK